MLYYDQNDETLVMLTLAGEQRAYEALVVRYERAVVAAANSVIHNINIAEDAAQDAFITAWMKLNMLNEPAKYGAWVTRIAKNCAKNMAVRFRSYLSLDVLENCISDDERVGSPEAMCISSEERKQLHESISGLPERVKEVIYLHYFEGLSIVEIADRMRISTGTVKWQLHDGRKRIRKELCAMNEDINDTLVQRVMKKVEELKLWKIKNSKNGFETVYKDVLAEVENLPESEKKYHALADVLMHGWWWLPGDKNDALLKRICKAAELGKNDEVMQFIVLKEDQNVYGTAASIEFILNKQIPRLEKGGFTKSLGQEWFWLGSNYFDNNEPEKGFEAYEKVLSILKPSDSYYAFALAAIEREKRRQSEYSEKNLNNCWLFAGACEFRILGGRICRWDNQWFAKGGLYAVDAYADQILTNASECDGRFTIDGLKPGETHCGSDGTTLSFASDSETVDTDCGSFTDCKLWITKTTEAVVKTWFKRGIGIVKQQRIQDCITETRTLKAYKINGGSGLIPFAKGNEWEYTADYNPDVMLQSAKFTVCYADEKTVTVTQVSSLERIKYDENSWADMMMQIRNDYCQRDNDEWKLCDVSYPMERAELLAKTPMEKAHTKAACSVARRILDTDTVFNPNYTAEGYRNFFNRRKATTFEGKTIYNDNRRWSFEWKHGCETDSYPLLYNDVIEILQWNTGCIWSDEWKAGAKLTWEHDQYGSAINTKIVCEDAGAITTKAGTFENCLKLSMNTSGYTDGVAYMGGKKEYYFAPGIGIVKTVNYYCDDVCTAVYELTSYEGTGEGYMPHINGASRRYDAINLTDGYVASADYTFVEDDDGVMTVFEDRCGIRKVLDNITNYGTILSEQIEQRLWDERKHDESRVRHDVNNFNILCHFLSRNARSWAKPERAAAWHKHKMKLFEFLGEGSGVPRAWLGAYAGSCFGAATALLGAGHLDEGYEYLDRAFELFPKWYEIPDGEALEVGNEMIYGGIKVIKGKPLIELPDGTRELIQYDDDLFSGFRFTNGYMYYGMTAKSGWEWFNGVRDEERFKKAIERAKKLMETFEK